jgi:hypothetical protein
MLLLRTMTLFWKKRVNVDVSSDIGVIADVFRKMIDNIATGARHLIQVHAEAPLQPQASAAARAHAAKGELNIARGAILSEQSGNTLIREPDQTPPETPPMSLSASRNKWATANLPDVSVHPTCCIY